ncbi:polyribonucleotide nucleotidyltransferase, partial [bacterium]|nr:polyribonucleotide nucleotidyltransferase [bacterium]
MFKKLEIEFADRPLSIETGRLARQADGAVMVRYGETMVLATACVAPSPREGVDFVPLTCDYIEKTFAAGKIPGGFFKREGRPAEKEILTSRFIDRPIRPLFPEGWSYETQIIATVFSVDRDNDPDMVAMIGASAALTISSIPWNGPIAGVRIGKLGEHLVLNPTHETVSDSS